ncbi:cellulose biosynthesis regulator YedQ [Pseudomonas sp. FW306-02-F02-AA]|uniref:diguanylate cyclase n=1 Tax=Pseudomonas fluorescens TaxID=294 RepID=A0A0N9WRQ3_PSEFL|nr:diguanylate cyclase [Pseudomonas fluorescens]PMZ05529.1 cellulose biosynthesis regulator YedQ [Pseudomonas sp. FW306-02-F02-AB]PMZ11098.1 cellulose biosynthesis regulator YedQ [Pseudomonas sp. FW306-02-H06C]PMZ17053.1 cellulose biosynthesis regulator YedQ [Pseudomonas sp. FW306-02-F02-AA]PMZ23299.1 cellulose biosynthesis regulator YedQ [Pseudomonas sp. FW306-02-F08-AA]PMZ29127.1 cellulose biosynthesis regulator YedQ [Pseudomonas sp. FW306-02-F04-BA]PMZ36464.1 cellulose biosynthesis regulat
MVVLTVWQIWTARENTLSDIETDTLNLTKALNTYTEGTFKQSEVVLLGLTDRIEKDGTGPQQLERLKVLVAQEMGALKQLNSVALYDAQGDWIFSTNKHVSPNSSHADRAFFKHHRDNSDRGIFIGPAILSRATGVWVISVSRRIDHPDGSFAGVIAATLSLEHFLKLYRTMSVGQYGAISLTSSEGRLLVRYPFQEQDIGRDLSRAPIFSEYLRKMSSGTVDFVSNVDGIHRIYAFTRSDQYPLVTTVAVGQDEAMQAWWSQTRQSVAVVMVLLGLLITLGRRLIADISHRIRAEADLRTTQTTLIELNQTLEVLASEDKLTGLANRRHFDQFLDIEFKRAKRQRSPLSLILIDVDFFKRYNDHYGHLAGDECLRIISQSIKQCVRRPADMTARYGGEEIAVVMPNTDESGARSVAEAILLGIAQARLEHLSSPFGSVTASLGLATFTAYDSEHDETSLIDLADRALYLAKSQGRNRLSVAAVGVQGESA